MFGFRFPRRPRPRLTISQRMYRKARIDGTVLLYQSRGNRDRDLPAKVTAWMDAWVIDKRPAQYRGQPLQPGFVPHPVWDDQWILNRDPFPTYAEAVAEIERQTGEPFVP